MLLSPCISRLIVALTVGVFTSTALPLHAGVYYDLGQPVVGGWQRSGWLVYDPVLDRDILWWQECSQDGAVLYGVDIHSGKVLEEHDIPARELTGLMQADEGIFYLLAVSGLNHPGNELLRFDPRKRKIERLGFAETPRNRPASGAIGKDGNVYIGTHQQGRLFRYDVKQDQWADLGQKVVSTVRPRQNIWLYIQNVLPDGRFLCSVTGSGNIIIDRDGQSFHQIDSLPRGRLSVLGDRILNPGRDGIRYFDTDFKPVGKLSFQSLEGREAYNKTDRISVLHIHPQAGVFARIGGDLVNIDIDQKRLRRIGKFPFRGSIRFSADGRYGVISHRFDKRFATLDLKTGSATEHQINYVGKRGTQICGLTKASDGSIYGTTIISMHVFRHDPKTETTQDLGHVGWSGGEVYNTIDYDGKIYLGSYGGGVWGLYDPTKPWQANFATRGTAASDNPRNLGRLGGKTPNAVNRPFEYVTGPDRNIYIASRANYGHPGGSLAQFDPRTGRMRIFRDRKRSIQTVTADDRYIFAGTNMRGGRGSGDRADDGTLFVHDPKTGKRIFEEAVVPDAKAVVSIRYNQADKQIYATTDNQKLIAFDPRKFQVTGTWTIRSPGTALAGVPEDVGVIFITAAADGNIYGVTSTDLFRFNVKQKKIEYLDKPPIPGLYQIVEGKPGVFYIGARTHLLRYHVNTPVFYR